MAKFWDKLRDFGSKIVSRIKDGVKWARDKALPFIRDKAIPFAKTVVPTVAGLFGHPEIGETVAMGADTAGRVLNAFK